MSPHSSDLDLWCRGPAKVSPSLRRLNSNGRDWTKWLFQVLDVHQRKSHVFLLGEACQLLGR